MSQKIEKVTIKYNMSAKAAAKTVDSAVNSAAGAANAASDIATTAEYASRTDRPPLTYSREDVLMYAMFALADHTCVDEAPYAYAGPFAHSIIATVFDEALEIKDYLEVEQALIEIARKASWYNGQHISEYMMQDLHDVPRWCRCAMAYFDGDAFELSVLDALRDYAANGAESEAQIHDSVVDQLTVQLEDEAALDAASDATIGKRVRLRKIRKRNIEKGAHHFARKNIISLEIQHLLDERRTGRVVRAIINAFRELLMNLAEGRYPVLANGMPVRPDDWRAY